MKGKTKEQKGITLIALIITIVVLLILAAVAISSIQNDGILSYAQNAADSWNGVQQNEQTLLDGYLEYLEGSAKIVDTNGNDVRNKTVTTNTTAYDKFGNKMVIPAGFMIRVDASTNNADTVTEGIVIEDADGNQFVWIPVGKIYTDIDKTEENAKTITLGRYVFADGKSDLDGNGEVSPAGEILELLSTTEPDGELFRKTTESFYFTEGLKNSDTANAHAKDIEAFIASADPTKGNGGYYIGRYEARKKTDGDVTKVSIVSTDEVWIRASQAIASSESQNMYASNSNFTSDLVNSYAWDTAMVFFQTFDNRTDPTKPYSMQNSLNSGTLATTGTKTDVICNVYDMASNAYEWTTETSSATNSDGTATPCVRRGAAYLNATICAAVRSSYVTTAASADFSFRPCLYVAVAQ